MWEDGGTTTILEFPVKQHHVTHGKVGPENKNRKYPQYVTFQTSFFKVEVRCRASAASGLYESETIVNVPVVRLVLTFKTHQNEY